MIPISDVRPLRFTEIETEGLILPFDRLGSETFLIVGQDNKLTAVFLAGEYKFESLECAEASAWSGVFISGIELRVNERSIYTLEGYSPTPGSLILNREGTSIYCMAGESRHFLRPIRAPISALNGQQRFETAVGISEWEAGKIIDGKWHPLVRIEVPNPIVNPQ